MRKSLLLLAVLSLISCGGEDYMPVYFRPVPDEAKEPESSATPLDGDCTVSFRSQLCVVLKGEKVDVGTKEDDKLCAEIPAFPLHIKGGREISINGNEFPDVKVEGHGLPAPITINGKGESDGTKNVGKGELRPDGNMKMDGYSFYINAVGVNVEVANLTLTTMETEKLEYLDSLKGSPPDASGAMILVTSTKIGHEFDTATDKFLGASLSATFSGSISPSLKECNGGKGEKSIRITEYETDAQGKGKEFPITGDDTLLISSGTFISQNPADVGGYFEAQKMFKVTNVSSKAIRYQIPQKLEPFYISSAQALDGTLKSQGSLILKIIFRPTIRDSKPGKVVKTLIAGTESFSLVGKALPQSGSAGIDTIGENGSTGEENISDLELGGLAVPANSKKKYFVCKEITCNKEKSLAECKPCQDPSSGECALLPVGNDEKPLGERDSKCKLINPDATPLLILDIKGSSRAPIIFTKQVVAVRNKGVTNLEIKGFKIEDLKNSKSKGEFEIANSEIFTASSFDSKEQKKVSPPFTLRPYIKGIQEESAFFTVTYHPMDLVGSDGALAGVGSSTIDRATLVISTSSGEMKTDLTGRTSIHEEPSLELYFKTSTGTRKIKNQQQFPFNNVTAETTDAAFPFFLKPSDTTQNMLRITGIKIKGPDAAFFQFLDTAEKIKQVKFETGKGLRCTIPVSGSQGKLQEISDPKPVSIIPPGFDLQSGIYTLENMPFFGCVNFHREKNDPSANKKTKFVAELVATAQEISPNGTPVRNADGSPKETSLSVSIAAAINPIKGKMVLRITQTMAAILNQKFPSLSSIAAYKEAEVSLKEGKIQPHDLQVFTGSMILDPFNEEVIKSSDGKKVLSDTADEFTAVFRAMSTHPSNTAYDDNYLYDFAGLSYDSSLPEGSRGIYEDYPNLPKNLKANGWRIFSGSLSYPGPVAPYEDRPFVPSHCFIPDPCNKEDLKKFSPTYVKPGEKGACAFFYASAGMFKSPAFHKKEEMTNGNYAPLCQEDRIDKRQDLLDINKGRYTIDGHITIEDIGLRLFGPTYIHNWFSPLDQVPPLDIILHLAFTTSTLRPQENTEEPNTIPDEKINASKRNYLINLTDKSFAESPPICERNTKNALVDGKKYSSWKYLAPLISKDPEGKEPAGCPDDDRKFNGGLAYLHGRPVDHETGVTTFVTVANFGSDKDLTFAFKDTTIFMILNGWLCNPLGSPEDDEGEKCYDLTFNKRDAQGQISITD